MKSGPVIVTIFDILNKIFRCDRGFLLSSDSSILPSDVTNLTKVSPVAAIARLVVVKVQAVTRVTKNVLTCRDPFYFNSLQLT